MNEKIPTFETNSESIPSNEEVINKVESLTGGEDYSDVRKLEDYKGIYMWEVRVDAPDVEGLYTEYSYQRAGKYGTMFAGATEIHAVYYDGEGMPRGSQLISTYTENGWEDYHG